MCEFISWVDRKGVAKFLTGEIISSTKFQNWVKQQHIPPEDYCGHGTIRAWYKIGSDEGIDKEQTDFTTPVNFPSSIVKAIKAGKFRGFPFPEGLLRKPLYDDYQAKQKSLSDDYLAKRQSLDDDHQAKVKSLSDDYRAKRKSLYDDYWAKVKSLYDDYWAKLKSLDDDHQAKRKSLSDDYWAKVKSLSDDYWAKRQSLDDDYWAMVTVESNRNREWLA